jgi:hypothetical protein
MPAAVNKTKQRTFRNRSCVNVRFRFLVIASPCSDTEATFYSEVQEGRQYESLRAKNVCVALETSGEHRLLACRSRQLADIGSDIVLRTPRSKTLPAGRPAITGWQPVLPRIYRALCGESFCEFRHSLTTIRRSLISHHLWPRGRSRTRSPRRVRPGCYSGGWRCCWSW